MYQELIAWMDLYKQLELGIPTYFILCKDSNGHSKIVAVCLLPDVSLYFTHYRVLVGRSVGKNGDCVWPINCI